MIIRANEAPTWKNSFFFTENPALNMMAGRATSKKSCKCVTLAAPVKHQP
jgi:hypothetical protein